MDTRIIYCGDCLDQLSSEPRPPALCVAQRCQGSGSGLLPKLPNGCVDLIYVDPPFNSNRNYEVFWGRQSEPEAQARDIPEPRAQASGFLAPFDDRHASTAAYIDYMRPRCVDPTLAEAYRRIAGAARDALTGQRAALSSGSCLAVRCAKGSSVSFALDWPMALRRDPHGN